MVIEVREAPVPVRYRFAGRLGLGKWFCEKDIPYSNITEVVVRNVSAVTVLSAHVELSNGQTVIVRAKK